MIRIAIIHPTFGRPRLAFEVMRERMKMAKNPFDIEYFMSMDDNDSSLMEYLHQCQANVYGRFVMDIGDSRTANQAMNRSAKQISPTTELIVAIADDVGVPKFWDETLMGLLKGIDNFKDPKYIVVSDGINTETYQYAIINRAFYNRVGFIQCPEYHSMYSDNDLYECGKILGLILAPHVVIEHRHHSRGLSKWDDTYWRTNNLDAVYQGQKVLAERKKRNFDL